MPTKKIYKKATEIIEELIKLGLNGWDSDFTITDKKKKIVTDVKFKVHLKKKKLKEKDL